ncbi:hypothetical protein CALCODRAFT_500174 [Calocera cornea HHB12733]|uniref:Uncharacterized protein n=1 Tax=Calocera cornea HHB12733 TaxID=1353952 RepID=A0A165E5T1_9BASI|nr:hypothetical protein CALCODRAFT_500174 [Calocera cornea HHB12733]
MPALVEWRGRHALCLSFEPGLSECTRRAGTTVRGSDPTTAAQNYTLCYSMQGILHPRTTRCMGLTIRRAAAPRICVMYPDVPFIVRTPPPPRITYLADQRQV